MISGANVFSVGTPDKPSDCTLLPFLTRIRAEALPLFAAVASTLIGLLSIDGCSCNPEPPTAGSVNGTAGVTPARVLIDLVPVLFPGLMVKS